VTEKNVLYTDSGESINAEKDSNDLKQGDSDNDE
jgi:hypothetical protein